MTRNGLVLTGLACLLVLGQTGSYPETLVLYLPWGRLKHQLIVIGLRGEFLAALCFMGELIPNGGDTSDTGNLEKVAFKSNACNNG
jgi:hypothetical protein